MKILLVNYEFKPQCGGAGLATYNMAKAFAGEGHRVTLLIGWDFAFGQPEALDGVDMHVISIKKKNIHQSTGKGLLGFVFKGIPAMRRLTKKERFDIIQFYFSVPTGLLKYGIRGKVPYVVSLRGVDIPGFREDRYTLMSRLTIPPNLWVTRGAAAVLALSAESAKYYRRIAPEIPITIIPNAVEHAKYQRKETYCGQVSRFVCVARLTSFKRLDLLVGAMARLHEEFPWVSLDIYGEGFLREELEKQIESLDATEYIALRGYESAENLVKLLPTYDVFALPSVAETFGVVFIEAMACGLPVVCADSGGPLEVVVEGKTGFLCKRDDEDDLLRGLRECVLHPEEMERFGRAGWQRVMENYTIPIVATEHLALYGRLIARQDDFMERSRATNA